MITRTLPRTLTLLGAIGVMALAPAPARAHCDGLDGPVVRAAQRALDTRNPALAVIWVQEQDAHEIQRVFDQTLTVRELGPHARELADRFFFETLVRLHRAGEGAPFTGLKPAGRDLGPAIPAADEAIRTGSVEPVLRLLTGVLEERLRERFVETMAATSFELHDLRAGRAYVKAYVEFIHFVERIYDGTTHAPEGHVEENGGTHR